MPIDPMKAARFHRTLRSKSQKKQAHQSHLFHHVMPNEQFDHSLSNRFVYGKRSDWYAAAAINGFCDVDLAVPIGYRRYLTPVELTRIAHPKRSQGMSLYEE